MNIYNLNELTDSNLLYNKKPPSFMKYIIIIVAILMLVLFLLANKTIKTYLVKSNGIIADENKQYITPKTSGEIKEVFIKEGQSVKQGDVLITINSTKVDSQINQISKQLDQYKRRIYLLEKNKKCLEEGKNRFNKNNKYEAEFFTKLKVEGIKKKEYIIDEKKLEMEGYSQSQIEELKQSSKNKLDELYINSIYDLEKEKSQYNLEKENLEVQLTELNKLRNEYTIIAGKSGTIHLNTKLTSGMSIQEGSMLGNILTTKKGLIIESMILASDRPRIHVGSNVDIQIHGLSKSEYGSINGNIISIDEDASINEKNGELYFKINIKPEKESLKDSNGNKVKLKIGMTSEVRIKYEKETYMKYFLDQIGIKFN